MVELIISSKSKALFSFSFLWYISYTSAIFSFLSSLFVLNLYCIGVSISFLLLLISDKTLLSVKILSSKFSALMHCFTSVFWSDVSNIIKSELNPNLSIYFLRILIQIEWNVPIHISFAFSPIRLLILSFISLAALFVNVIAKMFQGLTCFSSIKYAILCVNTFVFPLPAPAITRQGPSVSSTASFCLLFKFSNKFINFSSFLYYI